MLDIYQIVQIVPYKYIETYSKEPLGIGKIQSIDQIFSKDEA